MINIDEEIKAAMLNKEKSRLYVLRMIKSKFLEHKTSKGFRERDWNEITECQILMKLEKEWSDELQTLKNANRDYSELEEQLNILKTFIPEPPSKAEIYRLITASNIEPILKNTKSISDYIKKQYPSADNKIIVECLKTIG